MYLDATRSWGDTSSTTTGHLVVTFLHASLSCETIQVMSVVLYPPTKTVEAPTLRNLMDFPVLLPLTDKRGSTKWEGLPSH